MLHLCAVDMTRSTDNFMFRQQKNRARTPTQTNDPTMFPIHENFPYILTILKCLESLKFLDVLRYQFEKKKPNLLNGY